MKRNVLMREKQAEEVREKRARGQRTSVAARFLMLWTAAVLATAAAFVVHLSMRFETVRLGYDVGAARREQRRLIEQKRLLAIEAATLRQATRVETVARGTLEMDLPAPDRIVPITPRRRARSAAGRVR
ncbi:MAG: cell division protein FtsL [Myxococcota bacterium]